jgi:hypothetical protein
MIPLSVTLLRNGRSGRSIVGRRWHELSSREQTLVLALASIEVSLTATAAVDLYRRPAERLRGRKALWWPAILIQPVGPIAYLVVGRRR